jgi:hypothetical protein
VDLLCFEPPLSFIEEDDLHDESDTVRMDMLVEGSERFLSALREGECPERPYGSR